MAGLFKKRFRFKDEDDDELTVHFEKKLLMGQPNTADPQQQALSRSLEFGTSPSEQQTVPPVRSVLSDGTLRGSDTFFLFLFWCTCIWVATAKADAGGGGG